jgi:aldehyde:ferredoxin oxidoreductase
MMYASESRDPTIGSHMSSLLLADLLIEDHELAHQQFKIISEKTWGYADALDPTFVNKAPVAIWTQHQHILIDSLPMCDFAFPQVVRPLKDSADWQNSQDISGDLDIDRRLLMAVTGQDWTREELTIIAERAFTLERLMLARAGRSRAMEEKLAPHFQLPCRDDGTLIDPAGFSRLLDEYYTARGWDLELGWPTAVGLKRLGLEKTIPEIEQLRRDQRVIDHVSEEQK